MFRIKALHVKLAFFFIVFNVSFPKAQASIYDLGEYYFKKLGADLTVTAISQGADGVIWIGTSMGGLYRYDGYNFVPFRNSDDPNSIPSDAILSIYGAPDGLVWVGTVDDGLASYDPYTQKFTRYKYNPDDPYSLRNNRVRAIVGDGKGGIYVGNGKGVDYLPKNSSKFQRIENVDNPVGGRSTVYSLAYNANDGVLWVGTWKGLHHLKKGDNKLTTPFIDETGKAFFDEENIWTLMTDRQNKLWVGTRQSGVFRLDDGMLIKNMTHLNAKKDSKTHLQSSWVFAMSQAKFDEVWIATYGGGISIFSLSQQKIIKTIMNNPMNSNSLSLDNIGAMITDRSGVTWVGTWGKGINIVNQKNEAFRVMYPSKSQHSLTDANIMALLEMENGHIWAGTNSNGIDIIDPQKGVVDGIRMSKNKSKGLQAGGILSLARSGSEAVWIGSLQSGLYRFDLKKKTLRRFGDKEGIKDMQIRGIIANDDFVWVLGATTFYRVNPKNYDVIEIPMVNHSGKKLKATTYILRQQDNGTIWVNNHDGLYIVNKEKTQLLPVYLNGTKHGSLFGKIFPQMHIDHKGNLWVTTEKGLFELVERQDTNARFRHWNKEFADKELGILRSSLIFDNQGVGWHYGVRIDFKNKEIARLNKNNGIDIGTPNHDAQIKTKNGDLLFGGSTGLLTVRPQKYQRWDFVPPVFISSIKVNNKTRNLDRNDTIVLKPGTKSFILEYSALDYTDPKSTRYAYKLDGFDDEWNETGSDRHFASYSNIAPGRYKLLLKGSNRLQVWNPEPTEITVIQKPAWFQTIWFKLLVMVFALALIYAFFEFRTRKLKRQKQILKELVEEKTRDIQSILAAIQQGILAIDTDNGRVASEHSQYLTRLTGLDEITGRNFYNLLFEKSKFTEDEKDQMLSAVSASVGEDELSFAMNEHLLPREAIIEKSEDEQQILELDWNPITRDDIVVKILLVIRDVTKLRALEMASQDQMQEIEIIQEIINVPIDKFDSFIDACRQFIKENREIIEVTSTFDREAVQRLFRNMHTMKGLSRSYNLKSLSEASHLAEQYYNEAQKKKQWNKEEMEEALDIAQSIVDRYKKVNNEKLGRSSRDAQKIEVDRDIVELNLKLLDSYQLTDKSREHLQDIVGIKQLFHRLIRNPLSQILDDQVKSTGSIARQLKKVEPQVVFQDPGFSIDLKAHQFLNGVFSHLIRNSLDHGLEPAEERIRKGKREQGVLSFTLEEENGCLLIRYTDDGRGLDLPAIYQNALKKGILSESEKVSPETIANLIFASGFSTSETVTEISGRGVGMDAVKGFLEEKNCSITIHIADKQDFKELKPTHVEFIISLPGIYFKNMSDDLDFTDLSA